MTSDQSLTARIERLPPARRLEAERYIQAIKIAGDRERCEASLAQFARGAWPVLEPTTPMQWNWHLDVLCAYLQYGFFTGLLPRLIFNVPPGSMKSLLFSVFYDAWVWTQDPGHRFIGLANEDTLATRDNLRVRQLVQSEWYQDRWGNKVQTAPDQREKSNFTNQARGFRLALGIKANVTGKRGNTLQIDDPIDAKKAFSDVEIQSVNDAYDQAIATRLSQPNTDKIGIIMQRLRTNDLTGHVLGKKNQRWTLVRIPMRYEGRPSFNAAKDLGPEFAFLKDPRTKKGQLLWPERYSEATVQAMEEDLGDYGTAGQLQQRPSPLAGGIIKKAYWRVWGTEDWNKGLPRPACTHIFASWDTAFTEKDLETAAYSACTLWGVFWHEQMQRNALILLNKWWDRCDYPTLRAKAKKISRHLLNMEQGDAHLIERKASGISLIQDLKRDRRNRVRGYDPRGDGDKVARAYLSQPAFKIGLIYIVDKPWTQELIDIVGEFPAGGPPCKDITDTITQAVQYLVKGHWIHHPDDDDPHEQSITPTEEDEEDWEMQEEERRVGPYG